MKLCKKAEELLEQRGNELKNFWETGVATEVMTAEIKSPIEQLFMIEWYYQTNPYKAVRYHSDYLICPQFEIKVGKRKYKVDFLVIRSKNPSLLRKDECIIVELDSHIWHGSTPDQFAKEKERERELAKTGYRILRFSGREIIENVEKCVEEVIDYFNVIKS